MFTKLKDFWKNVVEVMREASSEVKKTVDKLPKPNPNVEVEWKDGQPIFKEKANTVVNTPTESSNNSTWKFPHIDLTPNPNIEVEWKDGQPIYTEKKKRNRKKKD